MVSMEKPNSSWIDGTAAEITTRSMYVIMYAATVSHSTVCRTRVGRIAVTCDAAPATAVSTVVLLDAIRITRALTRLASHA